MIHQNMCQEIANLLENNSVFLDKAIPRAVGIGKDALKFFVDELKLTYEDDRGLANLKVQGAAAAARVEGFMQKAEKDLAERVVHDGKDLFDWEE
jgi:hypothetical protein